VFANAAWLRGSAAAFVFYAVLERFAVFPGGDNLFDAGLPIADALDRIAGSNTVRRFAAI
jgi:hypothetical protein